MHEPVLLNEVLEYLHIQTNAKYIDATVGAGGHSSEIVQRGGIVLGLDADESMLKIAQKRLEEACPPHKDNFAGCFKLIHSNFRYISKVAKEENFVPVDGILLDLGVSNYHYLSDTRGFSFQHPNAPLDMRLDSQTDGVSAADILNVFREDQLKEMFEKAMDEPNSRRIAKAIVEYRKNKKFEFVSDLLECSKVLRIKSSRHPATQVFLALRMAVNSELENIVEVIPETIDLLKKGGRVAVITFHSLEDRVVKNAFTRLVKEGKAQEVTSRPVEPTEEEVKRNPKARSAKLRVIEKI